VHFALILGVFCDVFYMKQKYTVDTFAKIVVYYLIAIVKLRFSRKV